MESQCQIESTPAATAMRTPVSEVACAATFLLRAWASETTASISSLVQFPRESMYPSAVMRGLPVFAEILTQSLPYEVCSRTALRQPSAPSHTLNPVRDF